MDETHQFKFYVFKLVHEYLVILKQKVVYVVNKNERATEYDVVGALVARAVGYILYILTSCCYQLARRKDHEINSDQISAHPVKRFHDAIPRN